MITKLLRTREPGRHRKVHSPVPVPLVASAALAAGTIAIYLVIPAHHSPVAEKLHATDASAAMISLVPAPSYRASAAATHPQAHPSQTYTPRHKAAPTTTPTHTSVPTPEYTPKHAAPPAPTPTQTQTTAATGLSGTLGCSGLEQLWVSAGGNPADAEMAASIAMAESSGNQYAVSPTDDVGYWQINVAAHPTIATTNPTGNAEAAILISGDGSDWSPWTTYETGAYRGLC